MGSVCGGGKRGQVSLKAGKAATSVPVLFIRGFLSSNWGTYIAVQAPSSCISVLMNLTNYMLLDKYGNKRRVNCFGNISSR
jgi:hypothetical protein